MERTPTAMPCSAPATVPEKVVSSATFCPRFTPESTRSGLPPSTSSCTASMTQSVGVPETAKVLGSSRRTRTGSVRVSRRDAPDCSVSGAQTQTSSVRRLAIRTSACSPSAPIPSSLVMRILMRRLPPE